jgi:glucosamine--fructose-6-phosphate aminotransferase (isomerizing)
MCGIFAYNGNKQNAAQLTLKALKLLEYRGYDSWGIAIESKVEGQKSNVMVEKHVGKIGEATSDIPVGLPMEVSPMRMRILISIQIGPLLSYITV